MNEIPPAEFLKDINEKLPQLEECVKECEAEVRERTRACELMEVALQLRPHMEDFVALQKIKRDQAQEDLDEKKTMLEVMKKMTDVIKAKAKSQDESH